MKLYFLIALPILFIFIQNNCFGSGFESDSSFDFEAEFLFENYSDFDPESFLIVRNLDYYTNMSSLEVEVFFELNFTTDTASSDVYSDSESVVYFWNLTKSIKSYSKSFDEVLLNYSVNSFCVNVTAKDFLDPDLSNNYVCYFKMIDSLNSTKILLNDSRDLNESANFSDVLNFSNSSFNVSADSEDFGCYASIDVDETIYFFGDTIDFRFNATEQVFDKGLVYWVEDSLGKVVKSEVKTNSDSSKKFTPKLDRNEIYFIRSKVEGCDEVYSLPVFFVYNDSSSSESFSESEAVLKEVTFKDGLFFVNVVGFKNDTSKKTFYLWVDGVGVDKEKQKFSIDEKNSYFYLRSVFDLSYLDNDSVFYLNWEGLDLEKRFNFSYLGFYEASSDSCGCVLTENDQKDAGSEDFSVNLRELAESKNLLSSDSVDEMLKKEEYSKNSSYNNLITGQVVKSRGSGSSQMYVAIGIVGLGVFLFFVGKYWFLRLKKRKII